MATYDTVDKNVAPQLICVDEEDRHRQRIRHLSGSSKDGRAAVTGNGVCGKHDTQHGANTATAQTKQVAVFLKIIPINTILLLFRNLSIINNEKIA